MVFALRWQFGSEHFITTQTTVHKHGFHTQNSFCSLKPYNISRLEDIYKFRLAYRQLLISTIKLFRNSLGIGQQNSKYLSNFSSISLLWLATIGFSCMDFYHFSEYDRWKNLKLYKIKAPSLIESPFYCQNNYRK